MRWLYPSRMEKMRMPTLLLGAVWSVMGVIIILNLPQPSPTLGWISLFYPIYYTVGSVVFHFKS
jgi:prolipoprotein diacylglyceryltransferase